MKITNKYNLPEPLYRATVRQREPKYDVLSVTELIQPPQIRTLTMHHWDDIEQDASDRLWMVIGSGVHYLLEGSSKNELAEETLKMHITLAGNDYTLTGTPDLLDANETLWDYKITSVWTAVYGARAEWEQQLNAYRVLYEDQGFSVNRLANCLIFRDWQESKARDDGYPPRVLVNEVPLWPIDEARTWFRNRLLLHVTNVDRPDAELTPCTPEERWYRPGQWTVTKKGNKRAMRVLDSKEEAEKWAVDNVPLSTKVEITERPGKSARCWGYCPVSQWCEQFKGIKEAEGHEHPDRS